VIDLYQCFIILLEALHLQQANFETSFKYMFHFSVLVFV